MKKLKQETPRKHKLKNGKDILSMKRKVTVLSSPLYMIFHYLRIIIKLNIFLPLKN
jgi:hypothetical protein